MNERRVFYRRSNNTIQVAWGLERRLACRGLPLSFWFSSGILLLLLSEPVTGDYMEIIGITIEFELANISIVFKKKKWPTTPKTRKDESGIQRTRASKDQRSEGVLAWIWTSTRAKLDSSEVNWHEAKERCWHKHGISAEIWREIMSIGRKIMRWSRFRAMALL